LLHGCSGIKIGDDVTLSAFSKILSTGIDIDKWMEGKGKSHITTKQIIIGSHCWIGAGAILLPGVQITGEYVVIGAGAVVTHNFSESKVLIGGCPAKIIKKYT
jgi:acetyltransferase-like isoleucine patch superfamily enzyme